MYTKPTCFSIKIIDTKNDTSYIKVRKTKIYHNSMFLLRRYQKYTSNKKHKVEEYLY